MTSPVLPPDEPNPDRPSSPHAGALPAQPRHPGWWVTRVTWGRGCSQLLSRGVLEPPQSGNLCPRPWSRAKCDSSWALWGKDMKLEGVLFTVLLSGKSTPYSQPKKVSGGFSPQCHGRAGCLPVITMQHVPLFFCLIIGGGREGVPHLFLLLK